MSLILSLESSTAMASVALVKDGKTLAFESSMIQRAHSEFLNPAVTSCLKTAGASWEDLHAVAVSVGPGSFTGIRVAGNIAKTIAFSTNLKLIVCDSLEILFEQNKTSDLCLTMINAYKNMVYYSLNRGEQRLLPPGVLKVADLESFLRGYNGPCICVGDGYQAYEKIFSETVKQRLVRPTEAKDFPSAQTLGLLAEKKFKSNETIDWFSYIPLYLRASEAEENLKLG